MIFSGKLTETLNFYEIVEKQSASGFKWSEEVFMFKTKAERMKNKENYGINADELFHTNELTFRLRYRKEIKETDIVVYDGDRYRITSINKYLEDNQLIIMIQKINE